MFEHILLAVDGSEHALHAARKAAELARTMNTQELHIIVAYDTIPVYLGEPNMQIAYVNRKSEAEAILQHAVTEVGDVPGKVFTEVMEGDAAEAVITAATKYKSDLIVMGSRGLGRLSGLLLGSTSQKVVAHAPCPVLIVR